MNKKEGFELGVRCAGCRAQTSLCVYMGGAPSNMWRCVMWMLASPVLVLGSALTSGAAGKRPEVDVVRVASAVCEVRRAGADAGSADAYQRVEISLEEGRSTSPRFGSHCVCRQAQRALFKQRSCGRKARWVRSADEFRILLVTVVAIPSIVSFPPLSSKRCATHGYLRSLTVFELRTFRCSVNSCFLTYTMFKTQSVLGGRRAEEIEYIECFLKRGRPPVCHFRCRETNAPQAKAVRVVGRFPRSPVRLEFT